MCPLCCVPEIMGEWTLWMVNGDLLADWNKVDRQRRRKWGLKSLQSMSLQTSYYQLLLGRYHVYINK
jgi:hypothetical protein